MVTECSPRYIADVERRSEQLTGPLGRVAVIGGAGYIGSHIVADGRSVGSNVTAIAMPRVAGMAAGDRPTAADIGARADDWRRSHSDSFARLRRALEPFDVVINAAGLAGPGSHDRAALFSANAVLPALVARAARAAGVRRVVHISTAAVQGRLDPLDETAQHFPLSPYAASKAAGERFLLDSGQHQELPHEVIVYRPTSVHGVGHRATQSFAGLVARLPYFPVTGDGDRPVPVALIENVAAGVMFAATMAEPHPIVLQPSEQMTAAVLVELFGPRRVIHLPARITDVALSQAARMTARSAQLTAYLRWCEILLHGQQIQADVLAAAGFRPVADRESWLALGRHTRGH